MQFVIAEVELCFEVTFDSPSLDVGIKVWDVSTGTPVVALAVEAMENITGTNTYMGFFTPEDAKQYVVHKAVYTDGTFVTEDPAYSQASESVVCKKASVIIAETITIEVEV